MAQISDEETQKPVELVDSMIGMKEMGGTIDTPCFALLDGVSEDPATKKNTRMTIPVTRLPAIFGRSHDTDDPHFFGLGTKKALSRKQCMIYYRDAMGNRVDWDREDNELKYQQPSSSATTKTNKTNLKTPNDQLPEHGFFVIECLGKNRICVDKQKIEQGESVMLESGSAVRISSNMFYFLLPLDAVPKPIPVEHKSPPKKKKKTAKKRKSLSSSSPAEKASPTKKTKVNRPANSVRGGGGGGASQSYQAELDSLSTEELFERMSSAIARGEWERKHQMIGTVLSYHAVRDAARDPEIQKVAVDGGVPRTTIMSWIQDSPKYSQWTQQMHTKMEARSYQAAITKSLLKADFIRTGTSGRYVKWLLPKDIPITVTQEKRQEKKDAKKITSEEGKEQSEGDKDEKEEEEEEEKDSQGGNDGGENDEKKDKEDGSSHGSDNDDNISDNQEVGEKEESNENDDPIEEASTNEMETSTNSI